MRHWSRRDAGKILLTASTGFLLDVRETRAAGASSPDPSSTRTPEEGSTFGADAAPRQSPKSETKTWSQQIAAAPEPQWSDVLLVEGPEPIISYRTGWVVYEESLTNGQWVGRGWNGAGFINFYDGRLVPSEHRMPEAFRLEIDGQALLSDWKWSGCERQTLADGKTQTTVTLIHGVRPVTVKVHTALDGTAVLTRWLEVTNTSKQPAALATVSSWSGVLQKTERWRSASWRHQVAPVLSWLLRRRPLGGGGKFPVA